MDSKQGSSRRGTLCGVALAVFFAILSAAITLIVAKNFYSDQLCGTTLPEANLFKKDAEWDAASDRINSINDKFTVVATQGDERCYVMPKDQRTEAKGPRPLVLINQEVSEELVRAVAGEDVADFCYGLSAFFLRELTQEEMGGGRFKRQDEEAVAAPLGEKDYQGLKIPYEQRTPRCMDLVLDCSAEGAVGEVQTCFTWINGVLKMAQQCEAPNKFSIFMTKPPGRILKIAQKQMIECVLRRQKGLRC